MKYTALAADPVKPDKPSEPKHKYGEYRHVLLKDSEKQKLIEQYGQDMTDQAITFLDEYIEMRGYKANSHYLVIRKWVVDAVEERQQKAQRISGQQKQAFKPANKFHNFEQRSYDYETLQRKLLVGSVTTVGNQNS